MTDVKMTFYYPAEVVEKAPESFPEGLPVVYYGEDGSRVQIGTTGKAEALDGGLYIEVNINADPD